jgi:uncharacterized membrane protein
MSDVSTKSPDQGTACVATSCGTCAMKHAIVAETIWLALVGLLPFGAATAADTYIDMGVQLPSATMALLRFGRAMHPSENLVLFLLLIGCVAIISGTLIVAGKIGSAEVKRAARFAAIITIVAGIFAWIAVTAALILPSLRI